MADSRLKGSQKIGSDGAANLAISALSWLAGEETRLERFLSLSGLGPHNLRQAAREPRFLAAVLEYYIGNEGLLIEFTSEYKTSPQALVAAAAVLSEEKTREAP